MPNWDKIPTKPQVETGKLQLSSPFPAFSSHIHEIITTLLTANNNLSYPNVLKHSFPTFAQPEKKNYLEINKLRFSNLQI